MTANRLFLPLIALLLTAPAMRRTIRGVPGSACVPGGKSIDAAAHKTTVTSVRFPARAPSGRLNWSARCSASTAPPPPTSSS